MQSKYPDMVPGKHYGIALPNLEVVLPLLTEEVFFWDTIHLWRFTSKKLNDDLERVTSFPLWKKRVYVIVSLSRDNI